MANDIKLQEGHPVDENLRPIKVGGKSTAIETAQQGNGCRISGDLEVTGEIPRVHTGTIKGTARNLDIFLSDGGSVNIVDVDGQKRYSFLGSSPIIIMRDDDNPDDTFLINVAEHAETNLSTNDADGSEANLLISADGDLTFNSATGVFIAKNNATEFSVANSAYAGMILAYRLIGEDTAHASYTLTNAFVVPDSDMTVRFIAPPSGNVEVMVQVMCNMVTSNRIFYFGLSDNATYNTIGVEYEQVAYAGDETDDNIVQHYWGITGLTPNATYNYWFGAKITATTGYLNWGGDGSGRYCDFIMKVTALPEATSNFAVYG